VGENVAQGKVNSTRRNSIVIDKNQTLYVAIAEKNRIQMFDTTAISRRFE